MRKHMIAFVIIVNCSTLLYGQELTIGDEMPETRFETVVNYEKPTIEPEENKGKIVLYDFWATWCASCVANMPKMAEMQKKFGDDLKVILVTVQDSTTVNKFFAKRPSYKALGLPMITSDTTLVKYFPMKMIPQIVWVGKESVVKAITFSEQVTADNIRSLLQQNRLNLPVKHDLVNFDAEQPFRKPDLVNSTVLQQSLLSTYIPGVSSQSGFYQIDSNHTRFFNTNIDLMNLLFTAFDFRWSIPNWQHRQRFICETKQRELFKVYTEHDRQLQQCYCYEAICPGNNSLATKKVLALKLQADIENTFALQALVEKRMLACYVLRPAKKVDGKIFAGKVNIKTNGIQAENVSLKKLASSLAKVFDFEIPLIIEDEPLSPYSLELAMHYEDIGPLKELLEPKGILLQKEMREIEVLVVKDREASR